MDLGPQLHRTNLCMQYTHYTFEEAPRPVDHLSPALDLYGLSLLGIFLLCNLHILGVLPDPVAARFDSLLFLMEDLVVEKINAPSLHSSWRWLCLR